MTESEPKGLLERGAPETGEAPRAVKFAAGLGALWLLVASVLWESWRRPVFVILILLVIVIAHELGHFLVARRAGMACSEFFVGFGPRLWSTKRGDTEFGLKLVLLGGYVRILGMTNLEKVDAELEHKTYRQAPYRWRLATILAGVSVNLVLAFVCFAAVGIGQGDFKTTNSVRALVDQCRTLAEPNDAPSAPCPATTAGMRAGDVIAEIAGKPIREGNEVTAALEPRLGKPTEITVKRGQRNLDFTLTPVPKEDPVEGGLKKLENGRVAALIGIQPDVGTFPVSVGESPGWAWSQMWNTTTSTVGLLRNLVTLDGVQSQVDVAVGTSAESSPAGTPKGSSQEPSQADLERPRSVIGIVAIGQGAQTIWHFLALAAMINLALAILNLVPLVPLDGGHALVATYEAVASRIKRRRVFADYRKLAPVAAVFIAFLLFLFISSAIGDIREIVR
jgi:membrane-associated protease RseP (regulator of RpoE activity)